MLKVDSKSVICFDLDDTLYNEIDYLISAYREIATDLDPSNKDLYSKMLKWYNEGEDCFGNLARLYEVAKDELIQAYRQHVPDIQLFNGALQLLESIKEKDAKLVLITDGRSITQRNKIKALGISLLFDLVIISEELGTEKPALNNFQTVENSFPDHSYTYIADNYKKDFISPNQLGWNSIALVDNGRNIHKRPAMSELNSSMLPKLVVKSLEEISI